MCKKKPKKQILFQGSAYASDLFQLRVSTLLGGAPFSQMSVRSLPASLIPPLSAQEEQKAPYM